MEQVGGDPLSRRTAIVEHLRRSLVAALALGFAQVGVHRRAENRVRKRERTARAEDVGPGELGC